MADNEGCINHASYDHKNEDSRHIVIWHYFIPELLEFEIEKLDDAALKYAELVKIYLGGDHGKGAFIFIVIVLVRRKNVIKDSRHTEIKLGEIKEPKDCIEHIKQSLKKNKMVLIE